MCGISGFAGRFPGRDPAELLAAMSEVLRHRGPDDSGQFLDDGVGLAVRRLSIIDPAEGHQPIASEDGHVVVVCNGEIYNFVELRRSLEQAGHRFSTGSDVEVIVHLYEEHGDEFLHHLRGMFALALWDRRERRLLLARDRLGIKPLAYAETREGLLFGSEAKAILASRCLSAGLCVQGLADLLLLGFVIAPRTIFRGVRSLPPAHVLEYRDGRVRVWRYWDADFPARDEPVPERQEAEWAAGLRHHLDDAVRIHMRSDVPVAALLSAGLDSSAVLSLMPQASTTFSLRFETKGYDEFGKGFTLADDPRWPNVRPTCRSDEVAHLPAAIWHAENPSLTGLELSRGALARAVGEHGYKVVLCGEGSDEVLGGYRWFQGHRLTAPLARWPAWLRSAISLGRLGEHLRPGLAALLKAPSAIGMPRYAVMVNRPPTRGLLLDLLEPELARQLEGIEPEIDPPLPDAFSSWDPFCQLQYFEMRTRLPDLIVHTLDRSTMACSVEARVPFLDHPLVEYCSRIPPNLKMKRFREKYILRMAMEGIVPDEIRWRRKQGMRSPIADWLRRPLPAFADDLLSERRLAEIGLFQPAPVRDLLARHRRGEGHFAPALWGVLVLQLWDRLFVQRQSPASFGA